jgi:S-adenosylmethionine:tRNA ribosyltransferase-isomerase
MVIDFALPAELEAHDPPEARGLARDGVRMLVSRRSSGEISQHGFRDLPGLLLPGDLLVVNTSATLPAQVRALGGLGDLGGFGGDAGLAVHFSSPRPDGAWLVELRQVKNKISMPNGPGFPGQLISLPSGAVLTLEGKATARLWRARLSVAVVPYLLRHGLPIRYSYVGRDWALPFYQTVFAREPGSAEMPSAGRPFTPSVVTALVARGVLVAPLTLHTGVSSLEAGEDPYPEPYDVPPATARLVNHVRADGGRIIAAGTTVVRALETAALAADGRDGPDGPDGPHGPVAASAGWTSHVVTPETGVKVVDGLLTGLHEPRSSHLRMLAAFAGGELLSRCYETAIRSRYLWHEFGDVHLLLP